MTDVMDSRLFTFVSIATETLENQIKFQSKSESYIIL